MIKEFKKYFKDKGIYKGAIDNVINDAFVFAAKSIENKLYLEVKKLNNDIISLNGFIWAGNEINNLTSPQDIENAFKLISIAQANLDAIDIKEEIPSVVNFVPMADETKTDPTEPQQIGLTQQVLPKKMSMDDRFLLFSLLNR